MLAVADLAAWLSGLAAPLVPGGVRVVSGEWEPPTPNRLVMVLPVGGGGLVMEELYDEEAFSVHVRGAQGQYADAEGLAIALDKAIVAAPTPVTIGTLNVASIWRVSPPRFHQYDAARRSSFLASYIFLVQA